jgi:hypothetical protein
MARYKEKNMSKAKKVALSESGGEGFSVPMHRFRSTECISGRLFQRLGFSCHADAEGRWQRVARGDWPFAGTCEYKFIVDGEWCCEPGVADEHYAGEDAIPNAFGTKNRVIEVK